MDTFRSLTASLPLHMQIYKKVLPHVEIAFVDYFAHRCQIDCAIYIYRDEYGKLFSSLFVSQAVPIEILMKNDILNLKSVFLAKNEIF